MGGKKAHPIEREWYWMKNDPYTAYRGFDWSAIRRGRQIYSEVFAPCHSLGVLTFQHFQGFMTREEIKQLASQYEITDENPDNTGAKVVRPGRPTDALPAPYANQRAAQFANNGAEPPDLQLAHFARGGGVDYIFSLVTGYNWGNGELLPLPPFAPELKPGQFWNPYFKGCVLAMPPPLSDGLVTYEDGTPATVSQMAKDVCCFLRWTSEMDYDDRRVWMWKSYASMTLMAVVFFVQVQKFTNHQIYQRAKFRWWKKPY